MWAALDGSRAVMRQVLRVPSKGPVPVEPYGRSHGGSLPHRQAGARAPWRKLLTPRNIEEPSVYMRVWHNI
jgi:hypothetical protein